MIKLGIIGYGKIGAKHHEVFHHLGAKIVASCNRSELGREKAKNAGIRKTYADYHQMIASEDLDGIICSTSIFNNYKVAKEIIPYKIPILLEKPPGVSLEELNDLIQLKNQHGTLIMVATNRIWYSVLLKAIEDLGGKEKIEGVQLMWSENPTKLKEKRGFTEEQIHSRNYSNSIHGFSIINLLAGPMESLEVFGQENEVYFGRNMGLIGKSKSGVIVNLISSWSSILPWRLAFYGNNKIYDFVPLEQCVCTNLKTKNKREIIGAQFDSQFKPGFYLQGKHFLEIIGGNPQIRESTLHNAKEVFAYAETLTKEFEQCLE